MHLMFCLSIDLGSWNPFHKCILTLVRGSSIGCQLNIIGYLYSTKRSSPLGPIRPWIARLTIKVFPFFDARISSTQKPTEHPKEGGSAQITPYAQRIFPLLLALLLLLLLMVWHAQRPHEGATSSVERRSLFT